MKVYIVILNDIDQQPIYKVFDSENKAANYIAAQKDSFMFITEIYTVE